MKSIIILLCVTYAYGAYICPSNSKSAEWNNSSTSNDSESLGICYGLNTNWANYPYTVALIGSNRFPACTGTIIYDNPGIILTAAHCYGMITYHVPI